MNHLRDRLLVVDLEVRARTPRVQTKRKAGDLTVRDAGRLGGLTTLARHGVDHYRTAGRKGQAKLSMRFGKANRRAWGAMGGRPRKIILDGAGENR